MFEPHYSITERLLFTIKRITEEIGFLNGRRFPRLVLLELEREAREISTYASTSIEGNPLPLTDVKRLLKNEPSYIRNTEREVLNYNEALKYLNDEMRKGAEIPDEKLILKVHNKVTQGLLSPFASGKFRKEPVFVNDPRTAKTIFWPPDHQDVPRLVKELIAFVKERHEGVDPIILAGLFHKQFVLVHPFVDGNGRTVRLMTKILLAAMGINTFNLFSFERYYNLNVTHYFEQVGGRGDFYDTEKIDFTPWLEYFADGILDELLRVKKELEQTTFTPASKIKKHHESILNYLKRYGSIDDKTYSKLVARANSTRASDFSFLVEQKMIERHGGGPSTFYTLYGATVPVLFKETEKLLKEKRVTLKDMLNELDKVRHGTKSSTPSTSKSNLGNTRGKARRSGKSK